MENDWTREIERLKAENAELRAALKRETNEYIEAAHTLLVERDELKAEIKLLKQRQTVVTSLIRENERMEREIERLRNALDTIESMATDTSTDIQGVAQKALKEAEHET